MEVAVTDISQINENPYDFANPVHDITLLAGRNAELEDIKYYLSHAKTAYQPISIALIGNRASGKTSLLNICELEAKKRDLITVRLDMDEGDTISQMNFFNKLFDCIFSTLCEHNHFGGTIGKTYDMYLDIINAYKIPQTTDEKTLMPFLFPLQYAKAMLAGNNNVQLLDHNFRKDLYLFNEICKKTIVLLFDECDVFSSNKIILEKLRNIFMNQKGYMLVFTGTNNLFPILDDVFSPIIRQFKKINITAFKQESETEQCIKKPLENIGIVPEEIFDFETYNDVREIHDLSGGKPYEIKLLCHMLFKRIQNKQTTKMKLDFNVLEDVREELESSQDISIRPTLNKVKNLKKDQLLSLKILCICDHKITFEQAWALEYIFNGTKNNSKEKLYETLNFFIDNKIIIIDNNFIKYNGDDFDKIYIKYFARENKISLNFSEMPPEYVFFINLKSFVKKIDKLKLLNDFYLRKDEQKISNLISKLYEPDDDDDVFTSNNFINIELYKLLFKSRNIKMLKFLSVKIDIEWINIQCWFYSEEETSITQCSSLIKSIIEPRILDINGKIITEQFDVNILPFDKILKKILKSHNEKMKESIKDNHLLDMCIEYMENKNISEALSIAEILLDFYDLLTPSDYNNIGYIFFSAGNFVVAKKCFEISIHNYKESNECALPYYNLSAVEAKLNNFESAIIYINKSIDFAEKWNDNNRFCGCLHIAQIDNGKLVFVETFDHPNLYDCAIESRKIFNEISS